MGFESLLPLAGGLLGSQGSEQSQSSRQELDPRMQGILYGNGDQLGGLLGDAQSLYQSNRGGMNSQMLSGLNRQWDTLNNPSTQAGYTQMQQLGMGLMQSPIAGNPFTRQGTTQTGPQAGQQGPAAGFNPSTAQPFDIQALYQSIGRTGASAPTQAETRYWQEKGLSGDNLRNQFMTEAANYGRGLGYDQNIDAARGLLGAPRTQAFSMPAAPAQQAQMQAPARQSNPQDPYSGTPEDLLAYLNRTGGSY